MKLKNSTEIKIEIKKFDSLKDFIKYPLRYYLHKLSKLHLKNKERQLVVYSFDHIAHTINLDGLYERDYLKIFFKWAENNYPNIFKYTAVDIGANIGNHTLYFSDAFEKVIGYEAHPKTFKILKINTEDHSKISIHNIGISDKRGESFLIDSSSNMGGTRITDSRNNLKVKLDKLDNLIEKHLNIKLIKIDTEGHEAKVLRGAIKTIKENKPLILFEQQKNDYKEGKSEVVEILKKIGYNNFLIIEKSNFFKLQSDRFIGKFIDRLLGLISKEYFELRKVNIIPMRFFPFVIAIPDTVNKNLKSE